MRIEDLRFLVVEDHDFQRMALTNLLTTLGASHVHEAPNGRAALTLFQDMGRFVDIVVSDLDMPDMDGLEFIRHLGLARMPVSVILMSALGRQVIESTEVMTGAYGVKLLGALEKPVTAAALKALIERHDQDDGMGAARSACDV
ncbi:MAG: response regulator, partial [Bacillota bacterium]